MSFRVPKDEIRGTHMSQRIITSNLHLAGASSGIIYEAKTLLDNQNVAAGTIVITPETTRNIRVRFNQGTLGPNITLTLDVDPGLGSSGLVNSVIFHDVSYENPLALPATAIFGDFVLRQGTGGFTFRFRNITGSSYDASIPTNAFSILFMIIG